MDHQLEVINSLRITPLDDDDEGQDEVEEIEIDEDDEEEEEDEEGVTLGFVEKPKNPRSLLRHLFPSKAGGVPVIFSKSFKFFDFQLLLHVFVIFGGDLCVCRRGWIRWTCRRRVPELADFVAIPFNSFSRFSFICSLVFHSLDWF